MDCLFRLDRYIIEAVSIRLNGDYDRSIREHVGDVSSSVEHAWNSKNAKQARLTLEIDIHPTAGKENAFYPYHVNIKGAAFFTFADDYPSEQYDKALPLNGTSILYGLLRAQVVQITALSAHGQFLLPTLNFVEMQQSKPVSNTGKEKAKAKRSR